jgi:3-deoxy-D-manno-octulosonic-acid transferase
MRGGFRLLSLGSPKIRDGLRGRVGLADRVKIFRDQFPRDCVILFHCASAGELQALKPFVSAFEQDKIKLAVSYFSPSAKSALQKENRFSFADYSPVDSAALVHAYLDALRPSVIAITKHDVWPNMVWAARDRGIPIFLMNGNFHAGSLKLVPGLRSFHRSVYGAFTEIMVVSEEDASNARRIVGDTTRVTVIGDSRFDQVLHRIEQHVSLPTEIENACRDRNVVILGSTHADDEELTLPVIAKLSRDIQDLLALVVPHDPSSSAKRRIQSLASRSGLALRDLDEGKITSMDSALLINRTGLLADLYRLGRVAYVGGGFGKGVHSVLEPMVYHLPVITGPRIGVAYEARAGSERGFVAVVQGRNMMETRLRSWMTDSAARLEVGQLADQFVHEHSGATNRIAHRLREALNGSAKR